MQSSGELAYLVIQIAIIAVVIYAVWHIRKGIVKRVDSDPKTMSDKALRNVIKITNATLNGGCSMNGPKYQQALRRQNIAKEEIARRGGQY